MLILGLSCFYHDSAACIVKDGEIIAAAQEERFTRIKHDFNFPAKAVEYCLKEANCEVGDLDVVTFYDKPFIKFERILETYLTYAPVGFTSFIQAIPLWLREKLWIPELIKEKLNYTDKIIFSEHHESHAASAFFPSPFDEAAFITMDGVGEWATASYGIGKGNNVEINAELHFPHSIGLLYSAFTYYTGFKVNSGEYKVMGLAPYGEPKYVDLIKKYLIDIKDDGSVWMNMEYFNYCAGLTMTNQKFDKLFGGPPRKPESNLTQKDMDLARSVQEVTEEVMIKMARHVKKETGMKNLSLAGGVALNCVGNGKILKEKIFDNIWIQPAAGDAGGALGAALFTWYQYLGNPRTVVKQKDSQKGSFLGPEYTEDAIEKFLTQYKLPFNKVNSKDELFDKISNYMISEKIIGWFSGRMEFGPRALGARSILGDARSSKMQAIMNLKIKFRESFRPFAPSVLNEYKSDWFDIDAESPYMLLVADIKNEKQRKMTNEEVKLWGIEKLNIVRSEVPAITHIDYSARLQTVHKDTNPDYYGLIERFYSKTGCPVIINTSFNVRGEPIVCSPLDAYKCFMRTNMDYLVLGNYILSKEKQPEFVDDINWKEKFQLD